jgi:hypothetical protein
MLSDLAGGEKKDRVVDVKRAIDHREQGGRAKRADDR